MDLVVAGGSGLLGRSVAERMKSSVLNTVLCPSSKEMDIRDEGAVRSFLKGKKMDVLIHCAGWTDVDGAETHQKEANDLNVLGTKNLASVCKETGTPILFISTDYVFDGAKGSLYEEDDRCCPVNEYGRTKVLAEGIIRENEKHWIIRTSSLFGHGKRNFIDFALECSRTGDWFFAFEDILCSPTFAPDLAKAVEFLVFKRLPWGTYHATNKGNVSRNQVSDFVMSFYPGGTGRCAAITQTQIRLLAERPSFVGLSCGKLSNHGFDFRSWQEAVGEYVSQLSFKEVVCP